ncbi:hypothetical protein BJ170DRAFT_336053 [Xylariales sp. AK1849]|nr:hypothetical protein BJ170DRAFT_336053 [Xylariales sp. AK1849]
MRPQHSFVELNNARYNHDDEHAIVQEIHRGHHCKLHIYDCGMCGAQSSPSHLRPVISTGQIRGRDVWSSCIDQGTRPPSTEVRRWQSASELFDQYSIARPTGWLSDEEDLSFSGDGNASNPRFCRICHVCSARNWSPLLCSACGHRLCQRCLCEVPENNVEGHKGFSHHPSPTIELQGARYVEHPISAPESVHHQQRTGGSSTTHTHMQSSYRAEQNQSRIQRTVVIQTETKHKGRQINGPQRTASVPPPKNQKEETTSKTLAIRESQQSRQSNWKEDQSSSSAIGDASLRSRPTWSVKQNPFFLADRVATGKSAASPVSKDEGFDNPACRATHEGHHPYRHSTYCEQYKESDSKRIGIIPEHEQEFDNEISLPPLPSPTRTEQLSEELEHVHRHHSSGFHGPHHIAEHLAKALGIDFETLTSRSKVSELPASQPSRSKSRNVEISKSSKQVAPVQPVTEATPYQYVEVVMPPGHLRRDGTMEVPRFRNGKPSPSPKATPSGAQETRSPVRKLRHVESTKLGRSTPEGKLTEHGMSKESMETSTAMAHTRGLRQKPSADFTRSSQRRTKHRGSSQDDSRTADRLHATPKLRQVDFFYLEKDLVENATAPPQHEEVHSASVQEQHQAGTAINSFKKASQTKTEALPLSRIAHQDQSSAAPRPLEKPNPGKDFIARQKRHVEERTSSETANRIACNDQTRAVAPSPHVKSPPLWLKNPTKQPADIHTRLRHVSTSSQHNLWRSHLDNSQWIERSESLLDERKRHGCELSESKDEVGSASEQSASRNRKEAQVDSTTWYDLRSGLQSNEDEIIEVQMSLSQKAKGEAIVASDTETPVHADDHQDSSDACTSCCASSRDSSTVRGKHDHRGHNEHASPSVITTEHFLEEFKHKSETLQERYRRATLRAEEELQRMRVVQHAVQSEKDTTHTERQQVHPERHTRNKSANQPKTPSATASGFTTTPLQPRQLSFHENKDLESVNLSYRKTERNEASVRTDEHSELELHRPTAIAPPNHECCWKERYMGLTAEIRSLKAEISSRVDAEHSGYVQEQSMEKDDDLGIQGLTIVMHLKGKDDLVINTDLTQGVEE